MKNYINGSIVVTGHGKQPAGLASYQAKKAAAELAALAPYSVKKDTCYSSAPWHVYDDGKALCEFFETKKAAVAWIIEQKKRRETISSDAAPAVAVDEQPEQPAQDPAPAAQDTDENRRETISNNEQEEKRMSPVFEFLPAALVVNGKSFPAVYTIEENAVVIAATVQENGAERVVTINVPDTDKNYMLVYAVADETARAAAVVDEQPEQPAQDPAPAVAVDEQPEQPEQDPAPAAQDTDENRRETISNDASALAERRHAPEKPPRGVAPEKPFAGEKICGQGWTIVFDIALQRTRVIVQDENREQLRPIIENAGFYYSKNTDSWHKKLTFKAQRAAVALAENLRAAVA